MTASVITPRINVLDQITANAIQFVKAKLPEQVVSNPMNFIQIDPKDSENADNDTTSNNIDNNIASAESNRGSSRDSTSESDTNSTNSDASYDSGPESSTPYSDNENGAAITPLSSPDDDDQDDQDDQGDHDDVSQQNPSLARSLPSPSSVQYYDINESDNVLNGRIDKSWAHVSKSPIGLDNRGVTCYMNAAVQAIVHIPTMSSYLHKIAAGKVKGISGTSVSAELATLHQKLYDTGSKRRSIYPSRIIRRLNDINCMMSEWQQEDSHEYFMSLISRLQEDSVPKGKKLSSSIIHDIFGGTIKQRVTCKTCQHVSTTHQYFYDVSVSLTAKEKRELGSYTLQGSLREFFASELIKPDDKTKDSGPRGYKCEKCKSITSALKISQIEKAPEYLTVHMKRFKFMGGSHSQKLKDKMSYPMTLDLSQYSVSNEPIRYKLISVIVHEGRTVSSGHYIAYCRQPDNTWAEYDDECVRVVTERVVLRQESAYMLIYSRLAQKPLTNIQLDDPVPVKPAAKLKSVSPTASKQSSSLPTSPKRQVDDEINRIFTFNKRSKISN